MKRNGKRFLSLLLVTLMLIALLPLSVWAEETEPETEPEAEEFFTAPAETEQPAAPADAEMLVDMPETPSAEPEELPEEPAFEEPEHPAAEAPE